MFLPRQNDGQLIQRGFGLSFTTGVCAVKRYNAQVFKFDIASLVSGADYTFTVSEIDSTYTASGVQAKIDLVEGLRLAATTAIGDIFDVTGVTTGSILLYASTTDLIYAYTNTANLTSTEVLSARDASGVTTYKSPILVEGESATWINVVAPDNALGITLIPGRAMRISDNASDFSGGILFTSTMAPIKFDLHAGQGFWMRPNGTDDRVVNFMFDTLR